MDRKEVIEIRRKVIEEAKKPEVQHLQGYGNYFPDNNTMCFLGFVEHLFYPDYVGARFGYCGVDWDNAPTDFGSTLSELRDAIRIPGYGKAHFNFKASNDIYVQDWNDREKLTFAQIAERLESTPGYLEE